MISVMVLNRNNDYWSETTLKKAMKWLVAEKAEIVECDETREIGSIQFRIKMPLIVRLIRFFSYKPKNEKVVFGPRAIYKRDRNYCQYWHKDEDGTRFKYRCNVNDRTIDHVMPASRGGKNWFNNCVCACRHCNEIIKKNRTPKEAGLVLIKEPVVPKVKMDENVKITFPFNPTNRSHNLYFEKYLRGVIAY